MGILEILIGFKENPNGWPIIESFRKMNVRNWDVLKFKYRLFKKSESSVLLSEVILIIITTFFKKKKKKCNVV
jgi:hypothetical protein